MKFLNYIHIAAITAAIFSTGCSGKTEYSTIEGVVWNTTYHITYNGTDDMSEVISSTMTQVEMSLSPFQRNSAISRINRNETDSTDQMIGTVFNTSKHINAISNGAFDPTVAPLVNLWGFGYGNATADPSAEQIDSCLRLVGIADCNIIAGKMVKKSPGTQFNFSAITKGFGCDKIGTALKDRGCHDFMIEIGGELYLSGESPRGGKWRVMIEAPTDKSRQGIAIIEASDCGIATSGNYRNYHESDKGKIGHTISPVTGMPVQTEIISATVIAPDAMTADALATASMAQPLNDAVSMIESLRKGVSALFIVSRDDNWELVTAGEFPHITQRDV